ncbi:MAG: flavin prenyltransferase UbiX [Gammaproteobacteria bacterium]
MRHREAAHRIALAWTGASGIQYGLRLLECLLESGCQVSLMVSKPAQVVASMETDLVLPARPADIQSMLARQFSAAPGQLAVYGREQWTAPPASGSAVADAMVICPCTTATISAVATGASRSLIERAADVVLKESRKLLLVVRETPLSVIHLENMLRLAQAGAIVMPAAPGFYHRPQQVSELVDFMVARVMDHLGLAQTLVPPWGSSDDSDG